MITPPAPGPDDVPTAPAACDGTTKPHNWHCTNPACGAWFAEYVNGCPKCATGEVGGSHQVEHVFRCTACQDAARRDGEAMQREALDWCADQLVGIAELCDDQIEKERYGRIAERIRKGPKP